MKQNKPALIALVAVLVIALTATTLIFITSRCTVNGTNVCYSSETESFLIESDAQLVVQVESEAVGNYLVQTWNDIHPDNQGAVTFNVSKPLGIETLQEGNPYDIMIVSQTDAAFFLDQFKDMGRKVDSVVGSTVPQQIQDTINTKGYYMVQNSVQGPVFAYNKTLMEKLGYDLTDEDNSGLPDVFDSWEKIMEESPKLLETLDVVFPLTFSDQTSFYPFLTAGRWTLNFTKKGSDAGFSTKEFKDGLEFVEGLSEIVWDKTTAIDVVIEDQTTADIATTQQETVQTDTEKPEANDTSVESKPEDTQTETPTDSTNTETPATETPEVKTKRVNTADSLKWQYEESFYSQKSLFTVIQDFDLTQTYESSTGDTYVYAPFPTFNGHRLSPMATYVDGYVVSADVAYPSATAEVLRILRSPEAVSTFATSTNKIPVYHRSSMDQLTIEDAHVVERIKAYNFSDSQPVSALDKNPNVLARWLYRDVDFMQVLKDLFDGKITVEEAQEEFLGLSKAWLEIYDIIEEEQ